MNFITVESRGIHPIGKLPAKMSGKFERQIY